MHGFDSRTTATQRPSTSSKILVDPGDSPSRLDAAATHPLGRHTERTPHVTVFGGGEPCAGLPSRSVAGP